VLALKEESNTINGTGQTPQALQLMNFIRSSVFKKKKNNKN
jgi:hypothetical protein